MRGGIILCFRPGIVGFVEFSLLVGYPSGQRGQTVNLLAMLSMVRIHVLPPF